MSSRARSRKAVYVYLLCLSQAFHHTRHYLGSSNDPERRLREHKSGRGSHYTRAVVAAGIDMKIVRLWPGERYDEVLRKLSKNAARWCPHCREEFLRRDRERRRARREKLRAQETHRVELPAAA